MRRLVIGDRKLRVRDEGERAKAPLVLIHGAGASSVVWIDVIKRLSGRRRLVAPDLPGHGQSASWHAVSLEVYRDAVGTVCSQLDLRRAVLVGHSMGGAIALAMALAWPEKVAGLVLCSSGARLHIARAVFATIAAPETSLTEYLGRTAFSKSTPREVVDRWMAVIQPPKELMLADLRACDGFDVRAELPKITVPTLTIAGSDDQVISPERSVEVAALLPNARVAVLPHVGHMTPHEQPDLFHQALDPFLNELP